MAVNWIPACAGMTIGGRGYITFKVKVTDDGGDYDIDIELKDRYKVSADIRTALVTMKGVMDAREI